MVCINGLQNMMMETNMEDNKEENINPYYGQMETRYGALKVPEINDQSEKKKKLIPILKEDEDGE